jgi:uncharacterized protein (TIGR00251 family)
VTFAVRVVPRARRNEIVGVHGDALKVRLTAPPIGREGQRSPHCFPGSTVGVRKSQVEIVAGATSRHKMIRVIGLSTQEVERRLLG